MSAKPERVLLITMRLTVGDDRVPVVRAASYDLTGLAELAPVEAAGPIDEIAALVRAWMLGFLEA